MKTEEFEKMALELQIGNLVNVYEEGYAMVWSVSNLELGLTCISGCDGMFEDDEFEPIELTKKILFIK